LEVCTATVARERRRYCEEGLEVALMPRKPGRLRRRVLDGRAEAHLVALSCSDPPEGRERWSMRLLADRMVELGYVWMRSLTRPSGARSKNCLKPHLKRQWVIPPRKSVAFVWRMEEFALAMRRVAQECHPQANKIRVVLDNLSTHTGAAFYEIYPAEVARDLARRIEFVYTPVHGSWLNMVEVEISVLVRQCLRRRLRRTCRRWSEKRKKRGAVSAIG
jgi:hypothetical protein